MFYTYRTYEKNGNEDITIKEFESLQKAVAYIQRYARGIRFINATVESESGTVIYEICDYGSRTFVMGIEI